MHRFLRFFVILTLLFSSLTSLPPVQASYFEASEWTKRETYSDKIGHKLGFGFMNIFSGWTAFFFEPYYDESFFVGVGKGLFYTVTNTAGGLIHAATFPIPIDVPLPHGGIQYEYHRKK